MADNKKETKPEEGKEEDLPTEPQVAKDLEYTEAQTRGFGLAAYGNQTGNQIEDTLHPAGKFIGGALGALGGPVGGIVDPLLGGVLRGGGAYGEVAGVGYGNMDKKNEQADIDSRETMGGKKQDGENPLGL